MIGTLHSNGFQSIICTCLVFAVLRITSSDGCEFPAEIQTQVPHQSWNRSWYGEVREQLTSFGFQLEVSGGVIRQSPVDVRAGPAPITRRCVRLVHDDRYLVSDERGYSCLRFVMRSAEVMQIWASTVSREMDEDLCGDGSLRPQKWLTIDRTRYGTNRIRCPLEGGFTLSVFDKLRRRGVCDAWQGEIRLESECTYGEGLVFLFRTQSCVPEGMYMYATQPTHCLATWTEETYTFTIIRHDIYLYSWLLRFPSEASESFTTYLFRDFFADTGHIVTENLNYLRLDTSRNGARQPGDLCYDDYERCTHMTAPCTGGFHPPQAALTCPLKCRLCSQSSPVRCRLRPDWIGKWDSDVGIHNRSNSLTINGTTMIVHGHHASQDMRCVQWHGAASEGASNESVMLVSEYDNGCRPRYTCARVQSVSPSQLNVTFSKTVTWPFVRTENESLDCGATGFKPRNEMEANITRNLHLHWRTAQHPVTCHLPFKSSSAEVYFRNGTTCRGARLAEAGGRKVVEFSLRGCSKPGIVSNFEFSCLESSRFPPDDDLIMVARTLPSMDIYCFVFPFADDTTFHLIHGGDLCQSAILREANLDSIHLLRGTLSGINVRSTVPKAISSTEPSSSSAVPHIDVETSASASTTSRSDGLPIPTVTRAAAVAAASDRTPLGGEENATVSVTVVVPTAAVPTEHPFVVGFVAVLFAVVQSIIYLCNCL